MAFMENAALLIWYSEQFRSSLVAITRLGSVHYTTKCYAFNKFHPLKNDPT